MKYLIILLMSAFLIITDPAFAQDTPPSNYIKSPRKFIGEKSGEVEFGAELGEVRSTFLETVTSRTGTTYVYAEQITYILAGLGLLGMVLMATVGKWNWKWAFAICGGLFVLAGFQAIIYFLN